MKLRNLLAGAIGAVGVTAVANRFLSASAETFEPYLDGEAGTYRWRGFDIAYTEHGDPENEDLLLFHGISAASSSHEFFPIVDDLAEDYHVIVPDLPGFGHSDRPPLLYSASLYTTFVSDAITDLGDQPVVVANGLTGAYASEAAAETEIDRLVLITPTDSSMGDRQAWRRGLLRSPVVGEGLFNLLVSKPAIRYFNADHGYYDPDTLPSDVVDYEWLTAHQEGARFAPASFVSGFLDPETPLTETLEEVAEPVTLVWGRNSDVAPLSEGRDLAEAVGAGLVVFDRAKLMAHVEHPDQFVAVVRDEVYPEP
ncbi:MAG: alpha/beta hydrolase [Halovenus sp.]